MLPSECGVKRDGDHNLCHARAGHRLEVTSAGRQKSHLVDDSMTASMRTDSETVIAAVDGRLWEGTEAGGGPEQCHHGPAADAFCLAKKKRGDIVGDSRAMDSSHLRHCPACGIPV